MPKNNIALTIVLHWETRNVSSIFTTTIHWNILLILNLLKKIRPFGRFGNRWRAGGYIPSTIVDCTGDEPVIVRQGAVNWFIENFQPNKSKIVKLLLKFLRKFFYREPY